LPHQISSGDVDGAGEQWKKDEKEEENKERRKKENA